MTVERVGVSDLAELLTSTLQQLGTVQYENAMRRAMLAAAMTMIGDLQRELETSRRTTARLCDELRQVRAQLEAEAPAA